MRVNFILTLLSLVVSVVLLESAVRFLSLAPVVYRLSPEAADSAYQLSENPILGYEYKPSYRSNSPDLHRSFPLTNRFGFRDIERVLKKPPERKRILLVGDSVVAGHGIRDVPDLLHSRLEKELGTGIEVLNFGIGGYCTRAEIELLKERGLQFDTDLVLLLFVSNDYVNQNAEILRHLTPEGQPDRTKVVEQLFVYSHLFRTLSLRFDLFGLGAEHQAPMNDHRNAIGDNNVHEGLKLLAELSKEHSFETLIALWPEFLDSEITYVDRNRIPIGSERLEVEKIAKQFGLKTMRMDRLFNRHFAKKATKRTSGRLPSPRWMFTIGDGTHPSVLGAKAGAKVLAQLIRRSGKLPDDLLIIE